MLPGHTAPQLLSEQSTENHEKGKADPGKKKKNGNKDIPNTKSTLRHLAHEKYQRLQRLANQRQFFLTSTTLTKARCFSGRIPRLYLASTPTVFSSYL